jgi:heptosyltransferase-2/heptosyltransferase-3
LRSGRRANARRSLLSAAAPALAPLTRSARQTSAPRILLLRPDHLGDVLLTSRAIARLRVMLPRAHLTYVVGPWGEVVAARGPAVDVLETLAYPGFTRRPARHPVAPYTLLAETARRFRAQEFDVAIVLRPDHWWGALLALAAGIPLRVGSATPETTPLLTHARVLPPAEHATETALALVTLAANLCAPQGPAPAVPSREAGAGLVYRVPREAAERAAEVWSALGLVGRVVVAVQPSAGAPLKSWPVARWAAVADGLAARGCAVLLLGGPDDRALLHAIHSRMATPSAPAAVLAGQSLDESAALLARCRLLIGLDAGLSHVAGALGVATVRLYGPAAASHYGPWPASPSQQVLQTSRLACVPCGSLVGPPCGAVHEPACLLAIGVDDVLKAAEAQLGPD